VVLEIKTDLWLFFLVEITGLSWVSWSLLLFTRFFLFFSTHFFLKLTGFKKKVYYAKVKIFDCLSKCIDFDFKLLFKLILCTNGVVTWYLIGFVMACIKGNICIVLLKFSVFSQLDFCCCSVNCLVVKGCSFSSFLKGNKFNRMRKFVKLLVSYKKGFKIHVSTFFRCDDCWKMILDHLVDNQPQIHLEPWKCSF
jgi:hypothetical protein